MLKSTIWQSAAKSALYNARNQLFLRPVIWSLVRTYALKPIKQEHQKIREYGVLENYVPLEIIPYPIWNKRYHLIKYRNFKNMLKNTLNAAFIRNNEPKQPEDERLSLKWKARAKFLYEEMNRAFAKDDRIALDDICVDSMSLALKSQISKRAPRTRWKWSLEGDINKPRIVCMRYIPISKTPIAQITVRFHTKQLIVVYDKKGNIVAGNPKETKDVLEYVVFQRLLDEPGEPWRIYGKVRETEQKFELVVKH